ncbi:hypothetical protein NDN08_002021 [Rhodosorus marinus]|uniref:SAP domain-containing protein n=1 Tax=Rhodosorus marinus TaxID=101924 RepID=A0AAV8UTY5_9RHOD|nr:hypothetical protein NDN08_002021 [Rhodosorus marinus]
MPASTRARRGAQPQEQVSKVAKPILKSSKRKVRKVGGKANARSSLEGLLLTAAAAAAAGATEWMDSDAPPKYVDSLSAKKTQSTDKDNGSEVTGWSQEDSPKQRSTQNEMAAKMNSPEMPDRKSSSLADFLTPARDASSGSSPAPFFFSPFLSAIKKLTSRKSSASNLIAPALQKLPSFDDEEELAGDACGHSAVKVLEAAAESLLSEQAEIRTETQVPLDPEVTLGETKAAGENENGKVEPDLGLRDEVSRTNTVSALRIKLKAAGLNTNGKKAELVDRVIEAQLQNNQQLPNVPTSAQGPPSASSTRDKPAESNADENRSRKSRARTGSAGQPPATEDKPVEHGRQLNQSRGFERFKSVEPFGQVPKITQALYPEVSLLPDSHTRTGHASLPVSRNSLSRTPQGKAGLEDPQHIVPENRTTSTGNKVELSTVRSVSKKILCDDPQTNEQKRSSASGSRKPATRMARKMSSTGAEIEPAITPNPTPVQPLRLSERKGKPSLAKAASVEGSTPISPVSSGSTVKTRAPSRASSRRSRGISAENVDSAANQKVSAAIERVAERNSSTSNRTSLDITVDQDLFLQRQLEKEMALQKELKQKEILKRTKRSSRPRALEEEVQRTPGYQTPEVAVGTVVPTVPHTIRQERSANFTAANRKPSLVKPNQESAFPSRQPAVSKIPKPSLRTRRGRTDSTMPQAAGTVAKASPDLAKKAIEHPKPTIRKTAIKKASTALQSGSRVKKSQIPKRTTVARR